MSNLKGKIEFIELTDTGKVREHNEDAVGADMTVGLLVLADGMGGYNAGEVASGMAVKTTVDMVREGLKRENRGAIDTSTGLRRQSIILRDSILRANKIIYQTSKSQPQCEGMGTTIVACLFHDNRVSVAHVGDSRVYRMRNRQFQQITQDHSLLQELVDRGFYSPEEAQRSLNRNYVTRALGIEPTVEVEIQEESVRPEDLYVLCSDGLSDMVDDEDIHLTISTFNGNLDMIGKQLVQLTNDNGGRDNVSVVLARVLKSFEVSKGLFGKISSLFN
ncbi:MAG: Stp1/IreP family PP2C-type Ser/Thr phosphatase [Gammaproteobacteria bacterium]|nr:Stp1/IreP family PP2C-type Ser/Thr phosphatase [Gammaproteobacteria bacterium]MDH3768854.1 Stp1/IreP family PP2C-type Ser/Thr phosphatase [Gammaproteobacteria bacterium]